MNKFWKILYIVLGLALVGGLIFSSQHARVEREAEAEQAVRSEITFTQFLTAVRESGIETVTLRSTLAEGRLTESMAEQLGVEAPEFATRIIPFAGLFELLDAHRVPTVVAAPEDAGGGISPFRIIDVLATFLWIAFIIFLFRSIRARGKGGMMGGMGNIFESAAPKLISELNTKITFDDVLGVDEAKKEVSEIVDYLSDPLKYERIGAKLPKGVLLVGPPGTGKTMLAKAIAGEAQVPFFSISGSGFVEMFVGVGASRVRSLFDQAKKQSPCLVFIDEIDAVGRGRGMGYSNDEREQTLNQLLVEMDGFAPNEGIIVIAATNRPDILDDALTRPGRFDRQVVISLPDIKGREAILRKYAEKIKTQDSVDIAAVARGTPGFSGAELANLVNEAALASARFNRKLVSNADFEYARDKILMGIERRSATISPQELKTTAYHEAGHALLSVLLPGLDPIHKATIIPRGQSLGMVQQLPERDKVSINITEIKNQIAVSIAGRAAEEIFFGAANITAGASADIRQATRLARKAVVEWGFNPKLGTVFYGESPPGYADSARFNISDKTAEAIDEEVKNMIVAGMNLAKTTITKNKARAIRLAEALLKYETLTGEEIKAIIEGKELKIATLSETTIPPYKRGRSIPISAPRAPEAVAEEAAQKVKNGKKRK